MSSCSLFGLRRVLRPGGGLVVEGAGLEASVQDADQAVGELAQRGVVAGAAAAELVVVGAGAGRGGQRGEGLPGEGVDEPVVEDVAGKNGLLLACGQGVRAGCGVIRALADW